MECLLKDHVTLKTTVLTGINCIKKNSNREVILNYNIFDNITVFSIELYIDQIIAAFV